MKEDYLGEGISVCEDDDGTIIWLLNGSTHREDGPALIYPNDIKYEWFLYGQRHREGGPAYVNHETGFHSWWVNGERHRIDGPAIMYGGGAVEYWVNGICVDNTDRLKELAKLDDFGVLMLLLKFGDFPW